MTTETWRRISDWKLELQLVSLADVPAQLIAEQRWVLPADALAPAWPRLSALAAEVKLARVSPEVAALLRARGVTLHGFGFHRVSEGWYYARTGADPVRYAGDLHAMLPDTATDDDDEAFDDLRSSVVDAILRAASDGVLNERAVLIANEAAPLGPAAPVLAEAGMAEHERLGAAGFAPPASRELVEHVRAQLRSEPAPRPPLSREMVRNVRKALAVGVAGVGVAVLLREVAPWASVFGAALGVSALVIALLGYVQRR